MIISVVTIVGAVLNKEQSAEKPLPLITCRGYQDTRRVGVRNNLRTSPTPLWRITCHNIFTKRCCSMTMLVEIQQKITDTLREDLYAFLCPSRGQLFKQLSVQEVLKQTV
jgi:hypothetical protein